MHLKSDEEFQKNLAMAFAGEIACAQIMAAYGHQFEFDGYGAGSIEIFKDLALKRKRTPDLICALCKQKLEARSKSNLMITMSNSSSRQFDKELTSDVWVGFLRVSKRNNVTDSSDPDNWIASKHLYVISIGELTRTRRTSSQSATKPVEQGSETYLKWPILLAPRTGKITKIDKKAREIAITDAKGVVTVCRPPEGFFIYGALKLDSVVEKGETILCGIAKPLNSEQLQCGHSTSVKDP